LHIGVQKSEKFTLGLHIGVQKSEKFAESSHVSMQTMNKVYMVAEKVQKKFTSEVTKQLKKFTLMQKKFTSMQKKFTFFEKSLHHLSKNCKKVHIMQTSVNLCKLSEKFTSICPPMYECIPAVKPIMCSHIPLLCAGVIK
jgi:phage-related tail protein